VNLLSAVVVTYSSILLRASVLSVKSTSCVSLVIVYVAFDDTCVACFIESYTVVISVLCG